MMLSRNKTFKNMNIPEQKKSKKPPMIFKIAVVIESTGPCTFMITDGFRSSAQSTYTNLKT